MLPGLGVPLFPANNRAKMILDNENKNLKVHEWFSQYTENGKLDIVTGYFTIGALAYLSKQVNYKITDFRLILGDIINIDQEENRPLDLLNEKKGPPFRMTPFRKLLRDANAVNRGKTGCR